MIIYIVLFIILAVIIYGVAVYNSLVRLSNQVDEAFSTMDVYLKKRWDLIPNLVETVKGYAGHEKDTLQKIVQLRNGAYDTMSTDDKIQTNQQLTKGIRNIMALAENYPDLKASDNFKDLSNQLANVEEDIANARKYYNGVIKMFNNKVEMFPSNMIAGMFGYHTKTMFEAEAAERENVKVEF